MSDNTTLPVGAGGDTIRTLDKTGTGTPKTEVVALDLGGGDGRSEFITGFPLPTALSDVPVDDDGNPTFSLSPASMDALEILFRQTISALAYPQTALERAAGVTPINPQYPPIDVRRMGVIGDGVTDDTAALQRCFTVGGEWKIPAGFHIKCTTTIIGILAVRLYCDGPHTPGPTSTVGAFLLHNFNGTFFDLIGSGIDDQFDAGFSFQGIAFIQNYGAGTGVAGICIRNVSLSNIQRCSWTHFIDCFFEEVTGLYSWTWCIYIDGTADSSVGTENRDQFISRCRFVCSNSTGAVWLNGCANAFISEVEANLSNAILLITGVSGRPSTAFLMNTTWNTINLDWAIGVYGSGNTAATVHMTANTANCAFGCSCTGTPPTILGGQNSIWGQTSSLKWAITTNNNTRFEMGANTAEHSGPLASDVAVQAGTNPATVGVFRLPSAGYVASRNAANSANINLLRLNASDVGELVGPVNVTASASGITATINGAAANTQSLVLNAAASQYGGVRFDQNGSAQYSIFNSKTAGGTLSFFSHTTGVDQVIFNGAGNVTIAAPSSGAALTLPAGAATVEPLLLTSGTNLTTALAGAVEYDGTCKYFSLAASSRAVDIAEYVQVLNAAYTLTSQTAAQQLLNATTNGAVTLPVGTYEFDCCFALSSMSGTSGSFGFALGGAATFTQAWWALADKVALVTPSSPQMSFNTAANTTITTADTTTSGYAQITGIIRVTVAGTVIPQVSLTVAAAAIVATNSFFRARPVGNGTVTNVGNWS